jgi:sensor histidine kinase regulating citrate/malate metabolism
MAIRLQTKIFILIVLVVLLSLVIAGFFIARNVSVNIEQHLSRYILDLAHTVSLIPDVQNNVGKKDGALIIEPLVEKIRQKSQTEFIVVMDMKSKRYSHPVPQRIGQKFVGGDEGAALKGREYISRSIGTLGPSIRAFVPIFKDDRQVGAVSVGILLTKVRESVGMLLATIQKALLFALCIGFLGAGCLAHNVKQALFDLEPIEIATLVEEEQAIIGSIHEGIIAINKDGIITITNKEAGKLLGIEKNIIGMSLKEVIPNTHLPEVLQTGKAEYDQDQLFGNNRVLTSVIPVVIKDRVRGAVASFRNMTDVQKLAEKLTGVQKYVDALRAQSHEFKNKLHTIAGLLQLGEYKEAVELIMEINLKDQDMVDVLVKRIKTPLIGGLLLGKLAVAKENGIELVIDGQSSLKQILTKFFEIQLITVIGNLIDNAFDAVANLKENLRKVRILLDDQGESLLIEVEDWGMGISDHVASKIYEQGFTTKNGKNKGIGLTLCKNFVAEQNGRIFWHNKPAGGVVFQIVIPKGRGQDDEGGTGVDY